MHYWRTSIFLLGLAGVNGNAEWIQSNGPTGANASAFVEFESLIFAGSRNNGVYVSNNDGLTWSESSTGFRINSATNCLAKGAGMLYAGTDNGAYYSSDGGSAWTTMR